MFVKRDWTMLSLIVLAQVGLVICYLGLHPRFFPSKLASGLLDETSKANASEVVAQKPATAPGMDQPDAAGELLPASFNQAPQNANVGNAIKNTSPPVDAGYPLAPP
jgi:hypothetical protein